MMKKEDCFDGKNQINALEQISANNALYGQRKLLMRNYNFLNKAKILLKLQKKKKLLKRAVPKKSVQNDSFWKTKSNKIF